MCSIASAEAKRNEIVNDSFSSFFQGWEIKLDEIRGLFMCYLLWLHIIFRFVSTDLFEIVREQPFPQHYTTSMTDLGSIARSGCTPTSDEIVTSVVQL